MNILAQFGDVYLFTTKKNEQNPIRKITELFQCDFTYIGLVEEDEVKTNGYKEYIEAVKEKLDFKKYNLFIACKTTYKQTIDKRC